MPLSTESAPGLSTEGSQQKDFLCGPFHAARVLRDAGVRAWEGEPLDQDLVALHAGTALPEGDCASEVPPGAASRHDYRLPLPRIEPSRAGTPAPGLAAAIEKLSGGELACLPVSGEWSGWVVERLLSGAAAFDLRLLANLRTGGLWGSRAPVEALLGVLDGHAPPEAPAADWDVGHYVELVQLVRGRRGALVVIRDSYPSLGWGGIHVQPPAAVAAALMRGDGREGGVLAVGSPERVSSMADLAGELGLRTKIWDN
jgi:hypothetical protein